MMYRMVRQRYSPISIAIWRRSIYKGSINKYIERSSLSGKFRPARKVERLSNCLNHLPGEIEMAVKTRPRYTWTKRPRELYCSLAFASFFQLFRIGGRFVESEIPLFEMSEHHLVPHKNTGEGQGLLGGFPGE